MGFATSQRDQMEDAAGKKKHRPQGPSSFQVACCACVLLLGLWALAFSAGGVAPRMRGGHTAPENKTYTNVTVLTELIARQHAAIVTLHTALGRAARAPPQTDRRHATTSAAAAPPQRPPAVYAGPASLFPAEAAPATDAADFAPWRRVELTAEDWVVYLRVQKTGSQTLWLALLDVWDGGVWGATKCNRGPFCGDGTCEAVLEDAFRATLKMRRSCKLYVRAHANRRDYLRAAAVNNVPARRIRWLAFLREPVSRAISEHAHVTEGLVAQFGPHASGRVGNGPASLEDWLDCKPCRIGSTNRQTRFVAGRGRTGELESGEDGARLLADAKVALGACDFVGTLGRFQDSMLLLRETFPGPLEKLNAYSTAFHPKGKATLVSQATRDRIAEANRLDVELYAFANRIFQARWAQMLEALPDNRKAQRFTANKGRPTRFVLQ